MISSKRISRLTKSSGSMTFVTVARAFSGMKGCQWRTSRSGSGIRRLSRLRDFTPISTKTVTSGRRTSSRAHSGSRASTPSKPILRICDFHRFHRIFTILGKERKTTERSQAGSPPVWRFRYVIVELSLELFPCQSCLIFDLISHSYNEWKTSSGHMIKSPLATRFTTFLNVALCFTAFHSKTDSSVTVDENEIVRNRSRTFAPKLYFNIAFLSLENRCKTLKKSIKKTSSCRNLLVSSLLVPGTGLEPVWTIHPRDFKSLASTISPPGQTFGPP